MNNFNRDLHFDAILPRIKASSTKAVLQELSAAAAQHLNVSQEKLYELLMEQEEKSASGMGEGLAIPHLQVTGARTHFVALATLDTAVDFHAVDNQAADLVALVISPKIDGPLHLRRLSRISRLLSNTELHGKLCEAKDKDAIETLLMHPEGWLMAA